MLLAHHLIIKSASGEKQAQVTGDRGGFVSLASSMRVNEAGILSFVLPASHPVIPLLEEDGQVEHWRNGSMLFRTLYSGIPQYTVDVNDHELFTAVCYGERDMLNRSVIAWPAATINRTTFTSMAAESIMYTHVKYNATADATVENGRIITYPNSPITLEADLGRGTILTREDSSGKPLLQELRDIADVGDVDFDVVQTGPAIWVFRVYTHQLGVDRSSTVVFSRSRKNIADLSFNGSTQDPRSAIIVGGQGQEDDREFVVRYGPDYSALNHREFFEAYSGDSLSTAILQAEGDRIAQEMRIQSKFTFTPLQVAGARFGIDYNLGDLVGGVYRDVTATFQVIGVSISLEAGSNEQVAIELKQR